MFKSHNVSLGLVKHNEWHAGKSWSVINIGILLCFSSPKHFIPLPKYARIRLISGFTIISLVMSLKWAVCGSVNMRAGELASLLKVARSTDILFQFCVKTISLVNFKVSGRPSCFSSCRDGSHGSYGSYPDQPFVSWLAASLKCASRPT